MLQGKLELWDVDDVEGLCAGIVSKSGLELSHHEREDLCAYLIETCWELSLDWTPRNGGAFSTLATIAARRRIIDWKRSRFGRTRWQFADRTYERTLPSFVSLDDRPDCSDPTSEVDAGSSGLREILGLDRQRASEEARPDGERGEAADRVAA